MIKWKEFFQFMESAIDGCEDATNVIEPHHSEERVMAPMLIPHLILAAETTAPATAQANFGLVMVVFVAAIAFEFLNGFHDSANSIATVVSTRVLSPTQAVIWAAFFNFIAAFIFSTGVAKVVSDGYVVKDFVDVYVVFGGLLGAIAWNIITWVLGLLTSSVPCPDFRRGGGGDCQGRIPSPLFCGLEQGMGSDHRVSVSFANDRFCARHDQHGAGLVDFPAEYSIVRVDKLFRRLQLVSAGIYSLGHGGNDAQKTMGIIVMLLTTAGMGAVLHRRTEFAMEQNLPFHGWDSAFFGLTLPEHVIAWWIILTCHAAIVRWGRCVRGMADREDDGYVDYAAAACGRLLAETAAATTIITSTYLHIPISTTHAITGSILGVGSAKSIRSVRWIWGQRIVVAWVLTIPCSAFIAAIAYLIVSLLAR